MAYDKLKLTSEGAILVITLSDPATMNAAGVDMAAELRQALDDAAKPDSGVRAVVITGDAIVAVGPRADI